MANLRILTETNLPPASIESNPKNEARPNVFSVACIYYAFLRAPEENDDDVNMPILQRRLMRFLEDIRLKEEIEILLGECSQLSFAHFGLKVEIININTMSLELKVCLLKNEAFDGRIPKEHIDWENGIISFLLNTFDERKEVGIDKDSIAIYTTDNGHSMVVIVCMLNLTFDNELQPRKRSDKIEN